LSYVITAVFVVIAAVAVVAAIFVRIDNRPTARPTRVLLWRTWSEPQRVEPGDPCVCGGTVGKAGKTSARFGDLLDCTDCSRAWTMDGRKILRRRPSGPRQADRSPD
jgi:hypothetical protein